MSEIKKGKNIVTIVAIIILIILVAWLALALFSGKSSLDGIVRKYQRSYPDATLSIQKMQGTEAEQALGQIRQYCGAFSLDQFYLAQVLDAKTQKSVLFVINPITGRTECMIDRSIAVNASNGLSQNLIATINDEPIYTQELLDIYNAIPVAQRTNDSLQQSLDQLVANKLLIQDARKRGITASETEVNAAIDNLLLRTGISSQKLAENIRQSGLTMNDFRMRISAEIMLQKEVNEVTKEVPKPSDADVKVFYDQNKATMLANGQATTYQLLIEANESDREAKLQEIKDIAAKINASNFCDLVKQYSEDLTSRDRCGLYAFEQGELIPEYEQAVFHSEPGSLKIIGTPMGFHIVQIDNVTQARQLSMEEAAPGISDYLFMAQKQSALMSYVSQLKSSAGIVSYLE